MGGGGVVSRIEIDFTKSIGFIFLYAWWKYEGPTVFVMEFHFEEWSFEFARRMLALLAYVEQYNQSIPDTYGAAEITVGTPRKTQ